MERRPPMPMIARINMGPMAGILLCILGCFWALGDVPVLVTKGVDVELPRVGAWWPDVRQRDAGPRIGITRAETVFVNGAKVEDDAEIAQKLATIFKDSRAPKTVYVKADVGLAFGVVNRLVSLFQSAGVTHMILIANLRSEEASAEKH